MQALSTRLFLLLVARQGTCSRDCSVLSHFRRVFLSRHFKPRTRPAMGARFVQGDRCLRLVPVVLVLRVSRSEWVAKEAQYALERQRQTIDRKPDIVPFILDGPPPPEVPAFLSHLHFDDWMRYTIMASNLKAVARMAREAADRVVVP